MSNDSREIYFDKELQLEAYYFEGVSQKFPNHFHDYYVIGYIEKGVRSLTCNSETVTVKEGDFLLFNPFDSHGCSQVADHKLTYRALNISLERMKELVESITGKKELLKFAQPVLHPKALPEVFLSLHHLILEKQENFNKEELLYFLLDDLLNSGVHYSDSEGLEIPTIENLEKAKLFLDENFATVISLEEVSQLCGLNKYTLIRHFTKQFGVTPYQYVQTIRIRKAKELLTEGQELLSVGLEVGFSDQSHFTRTFKTLIGITPKQYQKIFF